MWYNKPMGRFTVYFDSECSFCCNVKRIIERLDKFHEITFAPLINNQNELMAVDEDGTIYYSEAAMTAIANVLPGIRRFSWMFKGDMGKKASQLFYQSLDTVRKLQKKVQGKPCTRC